MLNIQRKIIIKILIINFLIFAFFLFLKADISSDYWPYFHVYKNITLSEINIVSPLNINYVFHVLKKFNYNFEQARVILITLNFFILSYIFVKLIELGIINKNVFLEKKIFFFYTFFFSFIIFELFFIRMRTGLGLSLFLISIYLAWKKNFFAIITISLSIITAIEIFLILTWLILFIYFYKKKKRETVAINLILLLIFLFQLGHNDSFRNFSGELTVSKLNSHRLFLLGFIPYFIYLFQTKIVRLQYSNFAKIIFDFYFYLIFVIFITQSVLLNYYSGEKISRFLSLFLLIFFFLFIKDYKLKNNLIYIYFFLIYICLSIKPYLFFIN